MKKLIAAIIIGVLPVVALASEGGANLMKAHVDLSDKASLQRGAKLFVNYCLSCHSAAFERYNRMGRDLGLTDKEVKANLMFASSKVGDTMTVAMRSADGQKWFGNAPPDLSVMARARGSDYIYTYLKTFYLDSSRPTGVNNLALPNAAMPDVLWELEGLKKPVVKTEVDAEGHKHEVITGFEMVKKGKMTEAQFDQAAHDLTNFLTYLGEPARLVRERIGIKVLLFLAVLFIFAYALKKEYWKDVH